MKRFMNHSMTIFCLTLLAGAGAIFPFVNIASTSASQTADCAAAGSSLRLAQQHTVLGQARSVAAGDFNQDGRPDLAVAATGDAATNNISIFLGDGSGYLEHVVTVPVTDALGEVAAGDFNRDGKQDLAVSGQSTDGETGVAILLGNGDGSFRVTNTYAAGTGAGAMAIADFNGDGNQDIATANRFVSDISVLLGNGTGVFAAPVKYTVGESPVSIVSADFDGDGKPDLAVASQSRGFISLLTNKGSGEFNAAVNVEARGGCISIAAGDFNGDSKPDLVAGQSTSVAVLIGDGRGGFGAPKTFGSRTASSIVIKDFNGDGKADLALANNNTSIPSVVVMLGAGNGEFGAGANFGAGKSPSALATADFNQDGKDDLATVNQDPGSSSAAALSILFGDGAGRFRAPIISDGGVFPTSLNLSDLNKDNKPDIIITTGLNGGSISIGNGQGGFGAPQRLDTLAGFNSDGAAAAAGDFNKDGNVDVAIANQDRFSQTPQGLITILHGRGDGTFDRNRTRTFNAGNRAADIVAADFNGDGYLDLATANPASNDVSALLSNGMGGFGAAQNIPVGPEPRSLAAGDFNTDGKADLAVANRNSATLTIMLGDGKGGFNSTLIGIGANPRAVKTGDFNGDGKLDLAVPNNNTGLVSILLGNGAGSFNGPMSVFIGKLPFAVEIGDFNGDGKQDFAASVLVNQESAEDRVLIFAGDGTGRFGFAGEFTAPNARYLAASDVNADGLSDLAAIAGGNSSIWIALNECNTARPIALTSVSAASYRRLNLASDSIVAAFGAGLSAETAAATRLPLPTELAGTTVKVKDSAGVERAAQLFFVSPGQVNYLAPSGMAEGAATVTIANGGASSTGATRIAAVAPGIFTANANGQGVPAGVALRVKQNGEQTYEPIAQFDAAQNQFVPIEINFGGIPPIFNDQIFLILFGTGLRGHSSLSAVKALVGGVEAEVVFAAAQGALIGVDQVNVRLPRTQGEVDVALTVDGRVANTVKIRLR